MHTIEMLPESLKEFFTGSISVRPPTHRERAKELLDTLNLKSLDPNDTSEEKTILQGIKLVSLAEKFVEKVDLTDIKTGLKIESFEMLERDNRTLGALQSIGAKVLSGFSLGEISGNG